LVIALLLVPTSLAQDSESVVEVSTISLIGQSDLGIEALAVSPNGEDVLLVGVGGFAHFISATDPTVEVELYSNEGDDLNDVDWHPQGLTALIVGEDGTMVRYTREDHSITHVPGSTANLMGLQLNTVTWDSSGNWAYLGGDDGTIMRFREDGNGNAEYFPLNGSKSSDVLDLSCHHQMHSICVMTTESDGIAIIDQQHELHWLVGSEGVRWGAVICPHPERERCYAVGQGQSVGVVEINSNQPSHSFVAVKHVNIGAEFTDAHARDDGHVLLQTAPFGWIDWDITGGNDDLGLAYPWLDNIEIEDVAMRGESLVGAWAETGETGYAVTSYGRVVYYYPPEGTISDNIVSALAPMLVIIAVPGVVLGLLYIASPKLQKKYLEWSKPRRTAKRGKK
jgi:hypothetical protein